MSLYVTNSQQIAVRGLSHWHVIRACIFEVGVGLPRCVLHWP